jgi:hypothetical protein
LSTTTISAVSLAEIMEPTQSVNPLPALKLTIITEIGSTKYPHLLRKFLKFKSCDLLKSLSQNLKNGVFQEGITYK